MIIISIIAIVLLIAGYFFKKWLKKNGFVYSKSTKNFKEIKYKSKNDKTGIQTEYMGYRYF